MPERTAIAAFLDALGSRGSDALPTGEQLTELLAKHVAAGRAAWPAIAIDDAAFAHHLGERAPDSCGYAELAAMRAPELYLACACARGDRAAIAAFEARYGSHIEQALARLQMPAALADEVAQDVRARLFVADASAGERPLVADYAGRGALGLWLRTVAIHAGLKVLRRERRSVAFEDDGLIAPASDPGLAQLKETYAAEFRAAFASAMGALTARDRNILRQHFVDGLSIDDLGRLYRVHRATAARWLARLREDILDRTHAALRASLNVSQAELESIIRVAQSQLDVTVTRYLE